MHCCPHSRHRISSSHQCQLKKKRANVTHSHIGTNENEYVNNFKVLIRHRNTPINKFENND